MREFPLSSGTNAVKFIEDENGKPISELVDEIVNSTDEKSIQILNLELIVYIEVFHKMDAEARTDFAKAKWILDDRSIKYRKSLTGADTTTHEGRVAFLKEEARRPYITMTTHAPQDPKAFTDVYSINYDYDYELCKSNAFDVVGSMQVQNLHSLVVPAKYLLENPDSQLTDFFYTKARFLKNVYVDDDTDIDKLYVCIKSLN